MKNLVVTTIILCCFAATLSAQSRILNTDLLTDPLLIAKQQFNLALQFQDAGQRLPLSLWAQVAYHSPEAQEGEPQISDLTLVAELRYWAFGRQRFQSGANDRSGCMPGNDREDPLTSIFRGLYLGLGWMSQQQSESVVTGGEQSVVQTRQTGPAFSLGYQLSWSRLTFGVGYRGALSRPTKNAGSRAGMYQLANALRLEAGINF